MKSPYDFNGPDPYQPDGSIPAGFDPTVSYDGVLRGDPSSGDGGGGAGGFNPPPGSGRNGDPLLPKFTLNSTPTSGGGGYTPTPGQIGVGTGFQYTNPGFDDPATKQFFDLMSQLVGHLTKPINDPGGDTASATINQLLARMFGAPAPSPNAPPTSGPLPGSMQVDMQTGFESPGVLSASDAIPPTSGSQPGPGQSGGDLGTFQSQIDQIIQQLKGPVFSDPNLASLRTNAFDTLNHQRQADIQTTVRQLAQRGVAPNSPLVQSAIADVNRRWDAQEATQRQGLNSYEIGQQTARPGQIADLAGQRFSGTTAATTQGAQLAKMLSDLSASKRAEETGNYAKALGLTSSGVDLTNQRLAQVLQTINGVSGSSDVGSLLQSILGLTNATNAQNNVNGQNNSAWFQALGKLLAGTGQPQPAT